MSGPSNAVLHGNAAQPYRASSYRGGNPPSFYSLTYDSGYPHGNPPPTYPPATHYPPDTAAHPPKGSYVAYPPPAAYGAPAYYQSPPQNYDPYGKGEKPPWNSSNTPGPTAQDPISYYTPEELKADTAVPIRHAFVKKVYLILTIQLLYTFGFALLFSVVDSMRLWLLEFWWVALIFALVGLVLIIVVTCFRDVARSFPTNFILLSVITICMSWLVALGGATTSSLSFAIAAGITAAVCISLTIFAIQTKWDFTGWGVFAFVAAIILIIFGLLAAIIRSKILSIVYASLGAAVFSFYIVYDTQQIVGGKHRKYQYSIDDYIMAAVTLYMDVINLFLFILNLVDIASN